ncbi:hypothetical protein Lal_00015901 [Lupinus albus]|uniref:Uncharacterized protein n=1 Tax=Lupinus albus TaxID=3870 RepID=A0A6A4QHR6_LUPAL|nr:hypothetical protein Lalb_Chr05g0220181 [Lupinus albus]KAF1872809.1 hypothetical protein Lal_00015901 [Lupinus albus]
MELKPDTWAIYSETSRITKDHSGHLLALSAIFFLPLSCFYAIYISLSFKLLNHFYYNQNQSINPLFLYLLYSIVAMFFSVCGVSSITYSVFHAFYGTQFLGITPSPYFIGISSVVLVVLPMLCVVMYLQVRWILVPAVVVLESCWGLEALRRSASLIKGMKKVALILLLFFGLMEGIALWSIPVMNINLLMGSQNGTGRTTFDWDIVLGIVGKSLLLMIYLLYNTVANTVLYILCKGIIHHEDNKCVNNYVSLPLDDNV